MKLSIVAVTIIRLTGLMVEAHSSNTNASRLILNSCPHTVKHSAEGRLASFGAFENTIELIYNIIIFALMVFGHKLGCPER